MKYHLLLLEDVVNYGRKGDLVYAAPGYARNFLLPQGKALLASSATARMREKLQKEREEQAVRDRQISLQLAEKMQGKMFETTVKVDPEGHMYGSVTSADIAQILESQGFKVEKRSVVLHHPIRQIGNFQISLNLPEQVSLTIGLEVKPDRKIEKKKSKAKEEEHEAQAEGLVSEDSVAPSEDASEV